MKDNPGNRKHGMFGTSEYVAWMEMRRRCYDKRRKDYKNYGGRGIRVCAEWDHPGGFPVFFAHMGSKPGPGYTIGRKDNDGDYTPGNCEWQTVAAQNDNKSTTIHLSYRGRTLSLRVWADVLGVARSKLYQRLRKGWSVARTLTTP